MDYRLKPSINSAQHRLPLGELPAVFEPPAGAILPRFEEAFLKIVLAEETTALLGIITELPDCYSPNGLVASVGSERVGLAGWIIDRRLEPMPNRTKKPPGWRLPICAKEDSSGLPKAAGWKRPKRERAFGRL